MPARADVPCVDDGRGELRKVADATGPPDAVKPDNVRATMAFHDDIAAAVERNDGYGRYHIRPVVGIFQPTFLSARVRSGTLTVLQTAPAQDDGDGTVPRVSATPLELSDDSRERAMPPKRTRRCSTSMRCWCS